MLKNKVSGIYKITSPSGKIYIGQSANMDRRLREYKYRNNKTQRRLSNSIKKYGWKNHIFEIIEECSEEDLNCRERYWQDFYDVLGENGLNCVLQECGGERFIISEETRKIISKNSQRSRKKTILPEVSIEVKKMTEEFKMFEKTNKNIVKYTLINLETEEIFYGLDSASKITGINKNTLFRIFYGGRVNNTNLILLSDYKEDFEYEIKEFDLDYLKGTRVINLEDSKVYNTIKEASKTLNNINYLTFLKMLNGEIENKTTFRYL